MGFLNAQVDRLSLAGNWRIALDGNYKDWPFKTGESEQWYKKELPSQSELFLLNQIYFKNAAFAVNDWIQLPGSTDEAGIGVLLKEAQPYTVGLERKYTYNGAFWVQRKITIPENWAGRQITLFIERTLGGSTAYWDGQKAGSDYGYAIPHQILLDQHVSSGEHVLTILINKDEIRYEHTGHQDINANGTSWNGIVGRIELLSRTDQAQIHDLQVYPDMKQDRIGLKVILSDNDRYASRQLRIYVKRPEATSFSLLSTIDQPADSVFVNCHLLKPVSLWSEFEPNLYELRCELDVAGKIKDVYSTKFGMRSIGTDAGYIQINGNNVLMRGTLDCGSFPLQGYPFMEKAPWLKMMNTCKSYGLNHIRFHTWCPPDAAFDAADETGIYLQVELAGAPYTEINRILKNYGNHPSFCMLSLNNEVMGATTLNERVVAAAKKTDSRHLYSCTSHPVGPNRNDDYFISAWGIEKISDWPFAKPIVGITWGGGDGIHASRFNVHPPETASDFSSAIAGLKAPVIAHEMGQWAMFPDLKEIDKYAKGVLRNTNYERIQKQLERRGLLHLQQQFANASGKFSALLYKEEMESVLRTPGYAGFQLLGLNDYQGQYISVVGILNSFWESKDLVSGQQHRSYCNPIVPLAKLKKRTWKNQETFNAGVSISNFTFQDISHVRPQWTVFDENEVPLKSGILSERLLKKGTITDFPGIELSLKEIKAATKCILRISVPDLNIQNQWDFWVYPISDSIKSDEVYFVKASELNTADKLLRQGKKVLLQLDSASLISYRQPCFTPVFWNSILKWPQRSHTLGILCNPNHKALLNFPTEYHSNWQWWDIAMHSYAMTLDSLPVTVHPIIQVIDSYEINTRLAYLWECRVGAGKLMVTSIDFTRNLTERLASNQLKYSILKYMNSADFNPEVEIEFSQIRHLLNTGSAIESK